MAQMLPHKDIAILEIRKLEDYCLDPSHPRGRHKARVFRETLGLHRSDAPWLKATLLEALRFGNPTLDSADQWGMRWRLDALVSRLGKRAVVRSIWIVRPGETAPRFVTCWVP